MSFTWFDTPEWPVVQRVYEMPQVQAAVVDDLDHDNASSWEQVVWLVARYGRSLVVPFVYAPVSALYQEHGDALDELSDEDLLDLLRVRKRLWDTEILDDVIESALRHPQTGVEMW